MFLINPAEITGGYYCLYQVEQGVENTAELVELVMVYYSVAEGG